MGNFRNIYFEKHLQASNLDETATYPDEEDRELLDESDNEFSCSDDDSETCVLLIDNNSPNSKNDGWNTLSEELFFIFQSFGFFGGSLCDFLHGFILNWRQKSQMR